MATDYQFTSLSIAIGSYTTHTRAKPMTKKIEFQTDVKMVDIKLIKPYANNAKKHPKEQIEKLSKHIEHVGWDQPIVVDENNIILKGHGRLLAAKALDLKQVPIVIKTGLSEIQKKACRIADNKIADSGWDNDFLKAELKELMVDLDLLDLGFTEKDLANFGFLSETNALNKDKDEVDENAKTITSIGDLWQLGEHRLVVGDCTDETVVNRLLAGNKPNIMMTDPPYGVSLDASWREKSVKTRDGRPYNIRKVNRNTIKNDDRVDWEQAWKLFDGNIAYIWHSIFYFREVLNSLENTGILFCQPLIWDKIVTILSRTDYQVAHESCIYGIRKDANHDWIGDRKQKTIISVSPVTRSGKRGEATEHPSEKPLECMLMIKNHKGDVYEPFLGSGTTMIASEISKKKCYACELDPKYASIAIKRWETYTGKKAILLKD